MKGKAYEASRTKKQLLDKKRRGEKFVIWRISSKSQLQEIERLGLKKEPWLYEIKTKPFYNVKAIKSTLIKDIHFANKQGKRFITCRLKASEKKLLDDFGVAYRPIKYRIDLTTGRL